MDNICDRLDIIEKKIDLLLSKSQSVEKDCNKMSTHINFVESIINSYMPRLLLNLLSFKNIPQQIDNEDSTD